MNESQVIDIPRLIRIVTLLFALLAGTLVYLAFAPLVEVLESRIADAQATLRSDEVTAFESRRIRMERDALSRRYEPLFTENAEAVFLRELSVALRVHHVTLLSTSVTRDAPGKTPAVLLAPARVAIEMRGRYRDVLGTIAVLSLGSEIVEVDAPSLRRDGDAIIGSVPVTVYEPDASGSAAGTAADVRP